MYWWKECILQLLDEMCRICLSGTFGLHCSLTFLVFFFFFGLSIDERSGGHFGVFSPFRSNNVYSVKFCAPALGAYTFIIIISSYWINPLIIIVTLSVFTIVVLKSILSLPTLFSFAWNFCILSLGDSVYLYSEMNFLQTAYIVRSCFLYIYSANLKMAF